MTWPDRNRHLDYMIMGFYLVAFLIIYLEEIEQLIISNSGSFEYPAWPPRRLIDLTHWWGQQFHHTLYHRPS